MKFGNNILLLASLLTVSLASCSVDERSLDAETSEDKVSQTVAEALPGQLFVKFDASVSRILEDAGLTKSGADSPASRSGVLSVDEVLDLVEGYQIERVFPIDSRTEETARHEGLHLWYIVRFSEEYPVDKVAADLSKLGEVNRVEYNRTLKRASDAKAVPFTGSYSKAGVSQTGILSIMVRLSRFR